MTLDPQRGRRPQARTIVGSGRLRRVVISLVLTLLAALSLTAAPTATAAGSGVLNLQLTPINLTNGNTITDASNGTNDNKITYRVQFSCTTAACDNTLVQMSPAPPDPNGLLPDGEWIIEYDTWVPPAGGGTIGGTDTTGKLVDLGNLPAGTSGSFSITYAYSATRPAEIPNGSFYPEGFQIGMSAQATSDTAVAPVSAAAADVTWHIGTPAGPLAGLHPPNGTFKTDVPVTYNVSVNAGNMVTQAGACLSGNADVVAAGSYRIVYHLPPEAVIQSATDGGVVDNANHTVTWTSGTTAAPSYAARGAFGWHGPAGYNCGGPAVNNNLRPTTEDDALWRTRNVVVTYPGENFPQADPNGCNFAADLTSRVDVDVSYLDAATTQKSTSRTITSRIACTTPFGGLLVDKRIANGFAGQYMQGDGSLGGNPELLALNVTPPGETDAVNREWRVQVANRGNVDATATIDDDLVQPHLKVYRILAYPYTGAPDTWRATVDWVDNTGATGTSSLGANQFVDAAAGRWFVSARATVPVAAGRVLPTDATETTAQIGYRFKVDDSAPIGQEITNTAPVTLDYPADADGDGSDDAYTDLQGAPLPSRSLSATAVRTARYTKPASSLVGSFTGNPVVAGGGNPKVGTEVTYSMRARTDNVWPGTQLRPQLVFLAPAGWEIVPGSAQFTAPGDGETTTAPPGVTFDYATRTIGGVARQVVVATWPGPVTPSPTVNENWPTLSVKAKPTSAALAGTSVAAQMWAGDQSGTWSTAVGTSFVTNPTDFRALPTPVVVDEPDVDGDGTTAESYASSSSAGVIVAATDAIRVVKELCVPDTTADDGCTWVSDPTQVAGVPVNASDVKYRITVTNSGNTTLRNVVAYDVLPYPGDTGLLASPPARGSEFAMTFGAIESVDNGVSLSYSASTNPARPEVYPGAPGTVDDWGPGVVGKKAIRIQVDADLPANTSKTVVFTAAVSPGAQAGQVACNTAAIDSNETLPVEPLAVCVKLAEADLAVETGSLTSWRVDRATTVPFTVVNHGGTPDAGATVAVTVPAGVRVDDLNPPGWKCTALGGAPAPVPGAASLTCVPVDGAGAVRTLDVDVPESLVLAVTPTSASATPVCVGATISGPLFDPVVGNNQDAACRAIAAIVPVLTLDKSSVFAVDQNAVGLADVGDVLTYTFRVRNTGNVDVENVTIDDRKVSAIAPASADIVEGGSQSFTATYTVTQADVDAGGTDNTAIATGRAATGGSVTSNPDTDKVAGPEPVANVSIVKSARLTTDGGVIGKGDVGDVITYTFTVRNAGPATAHGVSVADPLNGLSAISPATVATLAPGDEQSFTATYPVTQSDLDRGSVVNQATVEFRRPTPPGGQVPAPQHAASNEVEVDMADRDASLSIVKSSTFAVDAHGDGLADAGDVLTYTFQVENTGAVTLSGVKVNDAMPGLSAISPAAASLAPGDTQRFTASYTVRQSDVDAGGTHNEATATGMPPRGPAVTSDPDDDKVGGPDPSTGRVSIVKSAKLTTDDGVPAKADAGDVITYTFVVHNEGPASARAVSVLDTLKGLSAVTPASVPSLAPGDDAVFTATYRVPAADAAAGAVQNQASVRYTPPTPRGAPTAPAPVTVPSNRVEIPTAPPAAGFNLVLDKRAVFGKKAVVGDKIRYRLQVANRGPDASAARIVLKDALPHGLALVSAKRSAGWDCSVKRATDRVRCVRNRKLAAGQKAPPVFVVAKAVSTGRVVNVASVRAGGDTVRSDNRDVAPVKVEAVPELPSTGYRVRVLGP